MDGPLPRQLGHEQLAAIADHVGIDVLERGGVGVDPGHVHPALVRERVTTDVRLVGVRGEVQQLVEEVGGRGQRRQLLVREALVAHLQLKVGDDRGEVGVAAPLAVPVHRPLNVRDPRSHRGQRVGHTAAGVVVAVDPDRDGLGL